MVKGGLTAFKGRRILLLQGPIGPFFNRLAIDLERAGAKVFKVNFNGGDWIFYPRNAFNYRGSLDEWPAYFEALVDQLNIDVLMLFGDCRPIHRVAHKAADELGLEIGVFEEGYVRPNHITLEQGGVNAFSKVPRSPIFYLNRPVPNLEQQMIVGNTFWYATCWGMLYYFFSGILTPLFPQYRHHRTLGWFSGGLPWLRSIWRKQYYRIKEQGMFKQLTTRYSERFFLVPLQTHNDAQIHTHSDYDSIESFILQTIDSFAEHAPRNRILVFKHHPLDRGFSDYSRVIGDQVKKHGLENRCHYIHDQHLPALLENALGVVVVNSTVGLSALYHRAPVKVCGDAIYDIKGLTFQRPLAQFWHQAKRGKRSKLFKRFYNYLVINTQLNGSFYKRLPIVASAAGLKWTPQSEVPSSEMQKHVANSREVR